jgi:hypothetical protein
MRGSRVTDRGFQLGTSHAQRKVTSVTSSGGAGEEVDKGGTSFLTAFCSEELGEACPVRHIRPGWADSGLAQKAQGDQGSPDTNKEKGTWTLLSWCSVFTE